MARHPFHRLCKFLAFVSLIELAGYALGYACAFGDLGVVCSGGHETALFVGCAGHLLTLQYAYFLFLTGEHDKVARSGAAFASAACV